MKTPQGKKEYATKEDGTPLRNIDFQTDMNTHHIGQGSHITKMSKKRVIQKMRRITKK